MIDTIEILSREFDDKVNRTVWLMPYTVENISKLWDKAKQHRILFHDDINGNFHAFLNTFLTIDGSNGSITGKGLTYIVDDFVGAFLMHNISRYDAVVSFSFFDAMLRYDVTRAMIKYAFEEFDFNRMTTEIVPYANKRVFKFVETLGFQHEGVKRNAHIYKERKYDLVQYGIIKERVIRGL